MSEVVRFLIVGGGTFFLEISLLYVLTDILGIYYLISSAVAFTITVFVNYVFCLCWVFQGKTNTNVKSRILFIGSSIVGLGINQVCMWAFVEWLGIYYLAAKVLSTGIVTVWNYCMKKKALNR